MVPTSRYKTEVNLQGTPNAGYSLAGEDGTASVEIKPGDLIKKVAPVGGNDEGLFTAADINVLPFRIADIVNIGVEELKDWSTFDTLTNYAVGEELRTMMPDAVPGAPWGVNVHNPGGVDLNLIVGDLVTVSSAVAGKCEKFTPDATTIVGHLLAMVIKAKTIGAGLDALTEVMWLGK